MLQHYRYDYEDDKHDGERSGQLAIFCDADWIKVGWLAGAAPPAAIIPHILGLEFNGHDIWTNAVEAWMKISSEDARLHAGPSLIVQDIPGASGQFTRLIRRIRMSFDGDYSMPRIMTHSGLKEPPIIATMHVSCASKFNDKDCLSGPWEAFALLVHDYEDWDIIEHRNIRLMEIDPPPMRSVDQLKNPPVIYP